MNTNLSRDVEGRKLVVACMSMKALENQLNKGQKDGDATKVITSGEIEEINELTPRMEASVGTHVVEKGNQKRREMQLAIIREQKENSLEDNEK